MERLSLSHNGVPLDDPSKTIEGAGITSDDMLLLRVSPAIKSHASPPPKETDEAEIERARQIVLSNPDIRAQLQQVQPELVRAAEHDPAQFGRLLRSHHDRIFSAERERLSTLRRLQEDPYDVEAQRKIETMIHQENIMESLHTAMEHHPESFGSVSMLYIPCKVNDNDIKAFVDCGAQTTIMNQRCAERCGLARLIDGQFSGIARGVGTSRIVGRVHCVQLKVGPLFLPCSVTIIEEGQRGGPEMLLGLDMLKRHQACIDLKRNVLVFGDATIAFLPESEIPKDEV